MPAHFELDPDYANIVVTCPMPGKEDLPSQTLEQFMQTEVGQRIIGEALKNADTLQDSGIDKETAIAIALGPAAVKDDEGMLVRLPREEDTSSSIEPETPKKKLN
ncbi:MAG: hypothetical protein ACR2FM_00925 [Candidatus Saccharimonadales bacterium]